MSSAVDSDLWWFERLYHDAFRAMLQRKEQGDLAGAQRAATDMYEASQELLSGREGGQWAYLFDWASPESLDLMSQAEEAKRTKQAIN